MVEACKFGKICGGAQRAEPMAAPRNRQLLKIAASAH